MKISILAVFVVAVAGLLTACDRPAKSPTAAESQPIDKLRRENQELKRLQVDNAELPRLREEYIELQQLKLQTSEIEKLRKENASLRVQLSGGKPEATASTEGVSGAAGKAGSAPGAGETNNVAEVGAAAVSPDIPQEGDQIWVTPDMLAAIIPGLDTSKIQRKEPVSINELLDSRGIVITNYQQLREMGVTNYQVKRVPAKQ